MSSPQWPQQDGSPYTQNDEFFASREGEAGGLGDTSLSPQMQFMQKGFKDPLLGSEGMCGEGNMQEELHQFQRPGRPGPRGDQPTVGGSSRKDLLETFMTSPQWPQQDRSPYAQNEEFFAGGAGDAAVRRDTSLPQQMQFVQKGIKDRPRENPPEGKAQEGPVARAPPAESPSEPSGQDKCEQPAPEHVMERVHELLAAKARELESWRAHRVGLEQQLAKVREEEIRLTVLSGKLDDEIEILQRELKRKREKQAELTSKLNEVHARIMNKRKQQRMPDPHAMHDVEVYTREMTKISERFIEARHFYEPDNLKNTFEKLKTDNERLKKELADTEERLNCAKLKLTSATQRSKNFSLGTQQDMNAALKIVVDELEQNNAKLEQECAELDEEIKVLEESNASMKLELSELRENPCNVMMARAAAVAATATATVTVSTSFDTVLSPPAKIPHLEIRK